MCQKYTKTYVKLQLHEKVQYVCGDLVLLVGLDFQISYNIITTLFCYIL